MMHLPTIIKKVLKGPGPIVILCIAFASTAAASSLTDYHRRIDTARAYTDELLKYSDESNPTFDDQKITALKTSVPSSEKIEWPGGGLETDNRWLALQLDDLADETNLANRGRILNGISERLLAISERIGELETAVSASRSKDDDKQKLAEILARLEYQKAQAKEESLFQRWIREFIEWLARIFPRAPLSPNASGMGSLQFGLQILIYALVISLVGFLIYKFAPLLARRFGLKTKKKREDRVILGERIRADASAADIFGEAERLAREGNLRGAIRKGYIALLCELSDRKVIGLARHKTNRDYLRDVRKNQRLFENMTGLTGSFERNWYGRRTTETQDWEDFRDRYRLTIGEVQN